MSIYGTWLSIDDNDHTPGVCAKYVPASSAAPGGWHARTADGRFWRRVEVACTCGNRAPIIYRGSHVNPSAEDRRGGVLLVCAIPDHCHPDARYDLDDEGRPVEFLRLFAVEDQTTEGGNHPGQATLVLDLSQVVQLRDTLTQWIETRSPSEATAVPEESVT